MATEVYEFRVDGRLNEQAREAFCDMRIEEVPSGATLYGDVIDESHLLGILTQFGVLGLIVVSAHPVASGTVGLPLSDVPGTTESRRPPPRRRSAGASVVDDHVAGLVSDGG